MLELCMSRFLILSTFAYKIINMAYNIFEVLLLFHL